MIMTMMDALHDHPSEIEIGNPESFRTFLESQKVVFHSQVDQLQDIVVKQCKLTGVNPLSQEMAAGALSIKIGKRPRDLLNPKAVKYMQSIFSIKDAVTKKESREISALFGVTVTQVREFFASQRSRVRRFVRLSKEKTSTTYENRDNNVLSTSNSMMPIDPVPLSSFGPSPEEGTSSFDEEKLLHGIGESDKHFADGIFNMMRKEETFSGQVNVMEWIMQIENLSVLTWFLLKGGLMILATWLSQAAAEEQTTILFVTLRVLCHLPLHQAPSSDISAIIQSVNKLRFYGRSDISNRARILLSRWSKLLATIEAIKKPNGMKSLTDVHNDLDLKQRINELIPWQSPIDVPDDTYGSLDYPRNLEAPQAMKFLTSSEDANRKHILGVSSTHNKERRKVQLVEQPGQKLAAKGPQVKTLSTNQARPITADEIQKAKIRAQFMQSKYGKSGSSSTEGSKTKTREGPKRASTVLTNDLLSASEAYLRPKLEAQKKARLLPAKNARQIESFPSQKPKSEQKGPLPEKCQSVRIPWQIPPDFQLKEAWRVGTGQGSKEVEVQKNRNRREAETLYQTGRDIPLNPKEPWDREMDYDDSLTPDIPIEQLPDSDTVAASASSLAPTTQPSHHHQVVAQHEISSTKTSSISPALPANNVPVPDLELLAVLLKNPELVYALTSGQSSGLSSEDTTKLLDMIKSSSGGASGMSDGGNHLVQEMRVEVSLPSPTPSRNMEVSLPSPTPPSRVEVSLPSPTPSSSSHGLSGWKEPAMNPFSHQPEAIPFPVPDTHKGTSRSSVYHHQHANTMVSSIYQPQQHPAVIGIQQPEMQQLLSLVQQQQQHSNQNHQLNTHHQFPVVQNRNTQVSELVYHNHQPLSSLTHSYTNSVYGKKSVATNIPYSPSRSVPPIGTQQQLVSLPLQQQLQNYDASSWSDREVGSFDANSHSSSHSNFHNTLGGGSMRPGHLWGGSTEFPRQQGRAECEGWSPEDSPSRYPPVRPGRSYGGQRMNTVGRYGPSHNTTTPGPGASGGSYEYQQQHWQGNRRWSDRARRR